MDDGLYQLDEPRRSCQRYRALARAVWSDHEAAQDDIRADLDSTLARWERAADKAATYHDQPIPDARATLEATLAAYQVGRADYASLFQAEVQLLDLERAVRMAEAGGPALHLWHVSRGGPGRPGDLSDLQHEPDADVGLDDRRGWVVQRRRELSS